MNDSDVIKSFESSWGKRFFVMGVTGLVAVLIGFVVWGFRGREIGRNAAALTPVTVPVQAPPTPAPSP